MSATAVNSGSARGVKDKRGGYSTLNLNYKGGGRGGDSKGYGMYMLGNWLMVYVYTICMGYNVYFEL